MNKILSTCNGWQISSTEIWEIFLSIPVDLRRLLVQSMCFTPFINSKEGRKNLAMRIVKRYGELKFEMCCSIPCLCCSCPYLDIDFQKSPSSCLFNTRRTSRDFVAPALKRRPSLRSLSFSTLKLMSSTCGKSNLKVATSRLNGLKNLA